MQKSRQMMALLSLLLAALPWLAVSSTAVEPGAPAGAQAGIVSPFFAFDNGLHGIQDPPKLLKELGYAGMGASGLKIGGSSSASSHWRPWKRTSSTPPRTPSASRSNSVRRTSRSSST